MPDFARYGRMGADAEPDPRPERREGDPPYRCLFCMNWRCDRPLMLCRECEGWYFAASAGMRREVGK